MKSSRFVSVLFFIFVSLISNCSSSQVEKPTSKIPLKKTPINGTCLSGNCWDGNGTFQYFNQDRFIGEFQNGLPNGKGLIIFQDGSFISGSFKNGKPHGFATEYDSNRRLIYSGEWVEGKKRDGL